MSFDDAENPEPSRPAAAGGVWAAWSSWRLLAWAAACLLANAALQAAVFAVTNDLFAPVAAGGLLGVVLPCALLARAHGGTLASEFRLDRPRARVIVWTLAATTGSLAPTAALASLSARLRPVPPEWETFLSSHLPSAPAPVALAYVTVAIVVPLAEELLFRGIVQRLADRKWGATAGVMLGAMLFALLHGEPWYLFGLIGVGLLLGYVFALTGSVTACAAAHGLHNAAALTILLHERTSGDATAGWETSDTILLAISLPVLALSCLALARAVRERRDTSADGPHL